MYANGEGVAQDDVLAYKWLTLAAVAGAPEAEGKRNSVSSRMTAAQIGAARHLAEEWNLAKGGK